MKLAILQENLQKALTTASRFASTRAQLPILGNILFSAHKANIDVSSTNLEISVSIKVGAKVEEEGKISIPARVISELVTNLPKDTLTIETAKEQMKISSKGFSSTILGMDPTDFPKIPNSVDKEKSLNLASNDLVAALSQVIFATSVDETRPVLTGVLFITESNSVTLVATDGFRLSLKKIKVPGIKVGQKVVLPKLVLSELGRVETGDVFFELDQKEKQAVFAIRETILSSRLLEGEYPDYEKIIPKKSETQAFLDKEELLRAVKLASVFARDAANIVRLKVQKDAIKVSAESGASGSQETEVEAKVEGAASKDFEIAFNFRFLEEFLNSVKGEEIKMEFSATDKPGIFTDTADSSYLHLIMPVKVQS